MALADITAKIEADARTESDGILARAKEQADILEQQAKREIEAMETQYGERFEQEKPEILRRRQIVANMDVRRMELGAKRALISDAFAGALEAAKKMDGEKYLRLIEALMKAGVKHGDESVIVGENETYLTSQWLEGYNSRSGTHLKMSDQKAARISGGFLLDKDRIRVNCTLDMLFATFQEDREADVVKHLFANS